MSLTEKQKNKLTENRLIAGGMAAVEVAAVLQLLQVQSLTRLLNGALWCFAASLPILVLCLTEFTIAPRPGVESSPRWLALLAGASLIGIAGLCLIFFHLNAVAGVVFLTSLVGCVAVVTYFATRP